MIKNVYAMEIDGKLKFNDDLPVFKNIDKCLDYYGLDRCGIRVDQILSIASIHDGVKYKVVRLKLEKY